MNGKAKQIIRSQMTLKNCSVSDLNKELKNKHGIELTEQSLANKISKGSFSGDFFIMVLEALGVHYEITTKERSDHEYNGSSRRNED